MIQFLVAALFRIESLHITMASHTSRSLLRRLIEQLQSMSSDRREELGRLVASKLCHDGYFAILMKDPLSTVQSVLLDLMTLCEQTGTLDDKYNICVFLNDRNIQDIWNGVVRDLDKDSLIFAVGH